MNTTERHINKPFMSIVVGQINKIWQWMFGASVTFTYESWDWTLLPFSYTHHNTAVHLTVATYGAIQRQVEPKK